MNIPKILLTIGGIITAGLVIKNDIKKQFDNRPTSDKDYILKQKIEADGSPENTNE